MSARQDIRALLLPLVGLPTEKFIFSDANGPRPKLPYSTLKVMSQRFVNHDYYEAPSNGEARTIGDREFTVTLEYIGSNAVDALQMVIDKMRLPSNIAAFYASNYTMFNSEQVADITALLDKTQFEERATVDLYFRAKRYLSEEIDIIEVVNIKSPDQEFDTELEATQQAIGQ